MIKRLCEVSQELKCIRVDKFDNVKSSVESQTNNRQANIGTDRPKDKQHNKYTDRQIDTRKDRQQYRQRQMERQHDRQKTEDSQTNKHEFLEIKCPRRTTALYYTSNVHL